MRRFYYALISSIPQRLSFGIFDRCVQVQSVYDFAPEIGRNEIFLIQFHEVVLEKQSANGVNHIRNRVGSIELAYAASSVDVKHAVVEVVEFVDKTTSNP